MFNNSLKMCLIALLTLGLAFTTACGDDDNKDNNKNNNNNTLTDTGNGDKDTGGGGDKDTDDGDKDTGETPEKPKTACESANPPARCTADPATFEFGVASVITKLEIAGDDTCCFDFDGDDEPDNMLGSTLNATKMLDTVNTTLADNIADGTLTVVLEHAGLTALTGGDFTINFFLGQYDTEEKLKLNPASLDAGTQPLAFLPGAKLTATGGVTAGPGNVILNLELFGTSLELSIREAKVSASVDAANSSLEEGVSLTTGKLGGLIIVNEVFDAVNKVADTCACLGLPSGTKLIADGSCFDEDKLAENTCDAESTCATLATSCAAITGAAILADQDYAGGEANAISIAATFEAKAAVIDGVGVAAE